MLAESRNAEADHRRGTIRAAMPIARSGYVAEIYAGNICRVNLYKYYDFFFRRYMQYDAPPSDTRRGAKSNRCDITVSDLTQCIPRRFIYL